MPKSKREKTLADYVVIAISPMLIMTLVGSLVFFLLQVSYHGEFEGRLKWILFWFISAAVLVARIAIEQGKEYASLFGMALTAAVALAAIRLVDQFLLAWVLLAVCWWCTWKLTWDCTLIDESEDASGEGLLQAAGFRDATAGGTAAAGSESAAEPTAARQTEANQTDIEQSDADPPPGNRPVHAPGKWLIYFSLAALPIFGIGQMFIPSGDTEGRSYGFSLLALYVASALGLLLTTSFLGLRRYLRQRKLQMPAKMTRAWLATGTVIALALLALALFLPQPQGEYSVTALVDKIDGKLREASRFAMLGGDRAKGEGRRIGQQDPDEKKGGEASPRDAKAQKKQGDGQQNEQDGGDQKGQNKDGGPGEKKSNDGQAQEKDQGQSGGGQKARGDRQQKADDQKQVADKRGGGERPKSAERQQSRSSPPNSSGSLLGRMLASFASFFKWLIYGAIVVAACILAWRHWPQIRRALDQLWAELLKLFGWRREQREAAAEGQAPPLAAEVPFSAYANPFFSGAAGGMSPAQLVRYTFEALEAWSREQVVARRPEQTPLEFAQELSRREPALAKDVTSAAELYVRVAYARRNPSRESVDALERLWRRMGMGAGVA
jgi:Domain of unknown function (DUF4129)